MTGTKTAQHRVPPKKMLAAARIPMRVPAAMKMGSHTNVTVRPTQAGPKTTLSNLSTKPFRPNASSLGLTSRKPSAQNWLIAAKMAPYVRARADCAARLPLE